MKPLYDKATTLQTDTRVRLEANYNRTIFGMTRPGEILYYRAPDDPSEHPMYVDSEGRIMPVSASTLQPMTNSSGNIVDKNGVVLPAGPVNGIVPHIDDVRVAVSSGDFEVKDHEDKEIYISHDGQIIPTDDEGAPMTTMVNGVPWAVDKDGNPVAPLRRVFPLRSYQPPVRAENVPINKNGSPAPKVEDPWPDYFDISHIVKSDRPSKRGVLVAWTAADEYDNPVMTGSGSYNNPRFYTASKDMRYKYWTSADVSEAEGVLTGSTVTTFNSSWSATGFYGRTDTANAIAGDVANTALTLKDTYVQRVLTLDTSNSYEVSFDVLPQADLKVEIELVQWSDTQSTTSPNFNAASVVKKGIIYSGRVPGGQISTVSATIDPEPYTVTHAIRIHVKRIVNATGNRRVTLQNFDMRTVVYPIAGVGPRAVYDRPIRVNKIVIGVDTSVDELAPGTTAKTNKPAEHDVRVYVDRGDGFFHWVTVATNPEIDDDGKIILNFDGTSWGDTPDYEASTEIMGVQYNVFSMRRRGARVNIMEISARRQYDVSDLLMDFSVNSEVSDESFILPFGTVNSNRGSVELSNHDGRFNHDNKFLLNRTRTGITLGDVYTTVENPFYRMLGEALDIYVDTATFEPGDEDRDWVRMATGRTNNDLAPGNNMSASIEIIDDSSVLQGIFPEATFYMGPDSSVIKVLYMLLDSVGYTSVRFAAEDEHFATHLNYFWTSKEGDSLWNIIADVCRATQTVAFYDEYNVLNFKSLRGLYEAALANTPAHLFTTEDTAITNANVKQITLENEVSVNKVNVNYRDVSMPEKTPSGNTPMEVVWEPEGTQVIRGAYITNNLNDKKPTAGGTKFFTIPGNNAKTWPFSGMIQVEGEFIRYDAKEYKWHNSAGKEAYSWVKDDDERKDLDKKNEYLAINNAYTGKMRISERGAEDSLIREHKASTLNDYTRRFRDSDKSLSYDNYNTGLFIKNSRLFVTKNSKAGANGITTITRGNVEDVKPIHMGTRFRINSGASAGICFGMSSPNEDGIFVEVSATEYLEKRGRPYGELHVFVRKGGKITHISPSIDVPISKVKDYTLDVDYKEGYMPKSNAVSYSAYYGVVLRYGNKGANVRVLQAALNKRGEKLAVDGSFGNATRAAVLRLQKKNSLTQDAIVRIEEWKALEIPAFDLTAVSVTAVIDGTYSLGVIIPKSKLPGGWSGGRFGLFTRSQTDASFEYLYGVRGGEDIEFNQSTFFDYVEGGFVSDQLEAGWIYDTKLKWVTTGGQKIQKRVINNQLYLDDFGPYAHEVKDYEVVFNEDKPAVSSYLYYSNEHGAMLIDYKHSPFGAKFRLVNKARRDVVLNGEDTSTFGSENAVEQRLMVYGTRLNISDERSISVVNKTATAARGVEELTVDVNWVQSQESANKLGSHIVESMSHPVRTYSLDVFGNATVKVGQIVSVLDPAMGIGDIDNPENANRFFVTGVNQSNDGSQSTTVNVREVIGSTGHRLTRLRDVLAANNNAGNMNPDMEKYERVGSVYLPVGYNFRGGVSAKYVSSSNGGGVYLAGTGTTPYQTAMTLKPFPGNDGRFGHTYGHYFLFTVTATATKEVAINLSVEGWPTTGSMTKVLASKITHVKPGETKQVTLKGQFLSDGEIPELWPTVRVLDPKNHANGAPAGLGLTVSHAYYRSSPNENDIYPLHGGANLRNI